MTRFRYQQVPLGETPYYHYIFRCVLRAFLCGRDHYSGQDYEYRSGSGSGHARALLAESWKATSLNRHASMNFYGKVLMVLHAA